MANKRMNGRETITASCADCVIQIGEKRVNFMQAIDLTATYKMTTKKVPILGRMTKGVKSVGMELSGKAKFHLNTSMFNKMAYDFLKDGKLHYFDIIVKNEDPNTTVGSQTVILRDCLVEGGTVAKFNADADTLTDEINFSIDRFELVEEYKELDGMQM